MKNTTFLFFLISISYSSTIFGQQLTHRTPLSPLDFILNPAMTAHGEYMEAGAFYRQQWAGFDNAPRTTAIYGQYPLIYQNVSFGGYFLKDETGLLDSDEFGITTSYKINIGLTNYDQLSIGISAIAKQLRFDGTNALATSNNDPSILNNELKIGSVNFGGGFFYTTDKTMFENQNNAFYIGASAMQFIPRGESTADTQSFKERFHATGTVGARIISNQVIINPSAWVSYATNSPVDVIGSLNFELEDVFWAGLAYQTGKTESTLYLQLGWIFTLGDGFLRTGMSANRGTGQTGGERGLGYEFLVAYQFWL
jgi:type IX secretion system PorP/SprF family membrane protein